MLSLDSPSSPAVYGGRVQVHGWVRGLGKARLDVLTAAGWRVLTRIHPTPAGRFTATVAARHSTELRLAYNGIAGATVTFGVAPRLNVHADGAELQRPRLAAAAVRGAAAHRQRVEAGRARDRQLRPHAASGELPHRGARRLCLCLTRLAARRPARRATCALDPNRGDPGGK